MLEIELPFPPSMNQYWRAVPSKTAGGRSIGARNILSEEGRGYRALVHQIIRPLGLEPMQGRLSLSIEFREPKPVRQRDLDNYNKALWDSLTHAGVWLDDSQIDHYTVSRGEPGAGVVMVAIQEI